MHIFVGVGVVPKRHVSYCHHFAPIVACKLFTFQSSPKQHVPLEPNLTGVFCSIYGFWLPLWYLVAIVLSVLLRYTDSDYSFRILWPLCCLSYDIRILITPLISYGHCVVCPSIYGFWLPLWYLVAIVLSVLWFTDSDYTFGILWSLCCVSFDLQILITPLVSCGHCVVFPLIYRFWLHLWYLMVIVLSVLWFTDSDYTFGIFDLQILITPLVSCGHCVVCSLIYRF